MQNAIAPPLRRRLKIFAFDPMPGWRPADEVVVDIPNESVEPGPVTERIAVADYDFTARRHYDAVDLNDPALLQQDGLDPSESDPRFHQQMVYAVARRVLENFDIALGRRIYFRKSYPLRIFPHALAMANAFYEPRLAALVFGYFPADGTSGRFVRGQTVYTCLSHDVIAHETTHALLHRLKPRYLSATNPDVAAFHEGFADVVAIFQHFSFPTILHETIRQTRNDLLAPGPLMELARQFGMATGNEGALRSGWSEAKAGEYEVLLEPHDRGSILVAAIFDAFFHVYRENVRPLVRLATSGREVLPPETEPPRDLVDLLAKEATRIAQAVLTMSIRAVEYLPPVDVTFGDFLRALVTADADINPADELGLRAAVIEAFRLRGVLPDHCTSLSEGAIRLDGGGLPKIPIGDHESEIYAAIRKMTIHWSRQVRVPVSPLGDASSPTTWRFDDELSRELEQTCEKYAVDHAAQLGFTNDGAGVEVVALHPTARFTRSRELLVDVVAELVQRTEADAAPVGATLVATAAGDVRYAIRKPGGAASLPGDLATFGLERQERFRRFNEQEIARDPFPAYGRSASRSIDFRSVHQWRHGR